MTARLVPMLPALFTLGNLVCGFVAICKGADAMQWQSDGGVFDPAFSQHITRGCWFIAAAMIFDALDGRVARLTGQSSPFGAMLDSLADVITFGAAPAFLAKVAYEHTVRSLDIPFRSTLVTMLCALYAIGAGLRLARFTVSTDSDAAKHQVFLGLPSPAAAATLVAALFFIYDGRAEIGLSPGLAEAVGTWTLRGLPLMAALLGVLMISRVHYVHVVQRYIGLRVRVVDLVKVVLAVWVILFFHEWALFAAALLYVLGGLVLALVARARGRSPEDELPEPWPAPDEDQTIAPS